MKPRRVYQPRKQEAEHRINELIKGVPEVRLIGENIEQGIFPFRDALKLADELELDLVEISANANPPVCKITDYSKFLYEKKKKDKELKSKIVKSVIKEIRFTPNTDDHDIDFKTKHAIKFLEEGSKVKAFVQFKGRAIMFKERGELLLLQFIQNLQDYGSIEQVPKLEGKRMMVTIVPKKK